MSHISPIMMYPIYQAAEARKQRELDCPHMLVDRVGGRLIPGLSVSRCRFCKVFFTKDKDIEIVTKWVKRQKQTMRKERRNEIKKRQDTWGDGGMSFLPDPSSVDF